MSTFEYYKMIRNHVQLEDVKLISLNCINRGLESEDENDQELSINLERKVNLIDSSNAEIYMKATVGFEERGPFLFEVSYCGLCRRIEDLDESTFENYAYDQIVPKITQIIDEAFSRCKTDEDINHLRGGIVEALIIGVNGGQVILNNDAYGWGAKVIINKNKSSNTVRYYCTEEKYHDCKNRSTVDFGYWNGYHGKFYECKIQPVNIGCKEVNYMETLSNELEDAQLTHEIYFVCPAPRDQIQMILTEYNLGVKYKAFGIEDLEKEAS